RGVCLICRSGIFRQVVPRSIPISTDLRIAGEPFCDLLISLLAVRNIQKTTKIDKLAKLGIGRNKHRYVYTTTLCLPPPHLIEGEESTPTGIKRCPHLRRGHIRRQRHGTGNQLTRKIWIEPVFIHADAEFVNQRTAYRITSNEKDAA